MREVAAVTGQERTWNPNDGGLVTKRHGETDFKVEKKLVLSTKSTKF